MLTRPIDDHFAVCTNIRSLCCTPKTNVISQLHLKKEKEKSVIWRTRQQQNSKPSERPGARRKVQNLCCDVLTAPAHSGPSPGFQSLPGPQLLSPDCPHPGLPAGIKTPLLK